MVRSREGRGQLTQDPGQAITLHIKHKDVQGPQDMKGFRFCVPFDYSMHNYLLRPT